MAPAGGGPCPWDVRAVFNPMTWGSSSAALGAPAWEKLVSVPGLAAHLWPCQRSEGACFHFLPSEQRRGAGQEPAALARVLWLRACGSSPSLRARGSSFPPGHKGDDKKAATHGGNRQETKA